MGDMADESYYIRVVLEAGGTLQSKSLSTEYAGGSRKEVEAAIADMATSENWQVNFEMDDGSWVCIPGRRVRLLFTIPAQVEQ